MKKPKDPSKICPYYQGQVQSYRFNGIRCTGGSSSFLERTLGQIAGWGKEQRAKKLADHCFGDFKACELYKFSQEYHGKKS